MLGFKASVLLREGLEDGALEVSKEALQLLKVFFFFQFEVLCSSCCFNTVYTFQKTSSQGMPHNVLPLQLIMEVQLTLLEKHQRVSFPFLSFLLFPCLLSLSLTPCLDFSFLLSFHFAFLIFSGRMIFDTLEI